MPLTSAKGEGNSKKKEIKNIHYAFSLRMDKTIMDRRTNRAEQTIVDGVKSIGGKLEAVQLEAHDPVVDLILEGSRIQTVIRL